MGLTIAFLGGVPPAMGGGGLELQMRRTADALRAHGHEVVGVESAERFDVLHAFRAETALYELLPHWRRNRVPLVASPVLVVANGRERRLLSVAARLPAPITSARMRRDALAQADAVVALTEHERELLSGVFAVPRERIEVIPNGVDDVEPAAPSSASVPAEPFLLLVGNVDRRKRQLDVLRAVGRLHPVVVAGAVREDAAGFSSSAAEAGATVLGEVVDPAAVRGLQAAAAATALLSSAEGLPLAVLESLAAGTPAIVSDIPVHRELAAAHPGWVRVVGGPSDVPGAFADLVARPPAGPRPAIGSWSDVATRLAALYARVTTLGRL